MRSIADIGELLEREEFEAGMLKWPGPTSYTRGTARSWRTCFRAGWGGSLLAFEISYPASRRSTAKGVRTRIFEAMSDDPDFEYLIIDFHPRPCPSHAAGAKKGV